MYRFIKQRFKANVNIIRYGFSQVCEDKKSAPNNYYLTIARAEKENNLDMVANAFKKLPNFKWKVVCNYNDTVFGKAFYKQYKQYKNIEIISANYNMDYIHSIRNNAKAYIHGHSVGGSNPALIEILPYNIPLFCYNNIFNRETTFNKAYYFNNVDELCKLLPDKDIKHNNELRELALYEYNWESIALDYKHLIESI